MEKTLVDLSKQSKNLLHWSHEEPDFLPLICLASVQTSAITYKMSMAIKVSSQYLSLRDASICSGHGPGLFYKLRLLLHFYGACDMELGYLPWYTLSSTKLRYAFISHSGQMAGASE